MAFKRTEMHKYLVNIQITSEFPMIPVIPTHVMIIPIR